ncbi:MAG: helix-turn-helix domain-containing protein [Muribaculaceae bacterium]|nr:helix-turn-helix domain-containing protein [Muribaculaceae bacterium]
MDIIGRLKQYMEHRQLSSSQLADTAGIARPTLSTLLNGRKKNTDDAQDNSKKGTQKISSDIIRKLHDAFPGLNVMWLLFGEGDMEDNSNIEISDGQNSEKNDDNSYQNNEYEIFNSLNLFEDEDSDLQSEKSNAPSAPQNKQIKPGQSVKTDVKSAPASFSTQPIALQPDKTKRVLSIMVFYSDNSFETFKPAE